MAEKVGLNDKYIQLIESGEQKPSLRTVYKLARALEIKIQKLFPLVLLCLCQSYISLS